MLRDSDFRVVKDEFGWKLINEHKLHILMKSVDKNNPLETKKAWRSSHTHLKSQRMAYVMRDNLIKGRIPKTKSERLLRSHMRVAEDEKYIEEIHQLILSRNKKGRQEYLKERREDYDSQNWR